MVLFFLFLAYLSSHFAICDAEFSCNGNIVEDEELGKVIQLQGDQRKNVSEFLLGKKLCKKENLKLHGF